MENCTPRTIWGSSFVYVVVDSTVCMCANLPKKHQYFGKAKNIQDEDCETTGKILRVICIDRFLRRPVLKSVTDSFGHRFMMLYEPHVVCVIRSERHVEGEGDHSLRKGVIRKATQEVLPVNAKSETLYEVRCIERTLTAPYCDCGETTDKCSSRGNEQAAYNSPDGRNSPTYSLGQ
jgi:hypothetical protein